MAVCDDGVFSANSGVAVAGFWRFFFDPLSAILLIGFFRIAEWLDLSN